jgi:hypothetical protein
MENFVPWFISKGKLFRSFHNFHLHCKSLCCFFIECARHKMKIDKGKNFSISTNFRIDEIRLYVNKMLPAKCEAKRFSRSENQTITNILFIDFFFYFLFYIFMRERKGSKTDFHVTVNMSNLLINEDGLKKSFDPFFMSSRRFSVLRMEEMSLSFCFVSFFLCSFQFKRWLD